MSCRGKVVFPTPVGVFPHADAQEAPGCRLPHARGGVSLDSASGMTGAMSSPRPWGCFQMSAADLLREGVFPTPVGVFPPRPGEGQLRQGLPHARGGVSPAEFIDLARTASSPRPWGCFQNPRRKAQAKAVFPTPVGVFPSC